MLPSLLFLSVVEQPGWFSIHLFAMSMSAEDSSSTVVAVAVVVVLCTNVLNLLWNEHKTSQQNK